MNKEKSTPVLISQLIELRELSCTNLGDMDSLFPSPNRIWNKYKLFDIGDFISSENAVLYIQTKGYEPANSHELLLWNEWNGEDSVVAVGNRLSIVLCLDNNKRLICCYRDVFNWDPFVYRFLAVSNS